MDFWTTLLLNVSFINIVIVLGTDEQIKNQDDKTVRSGGKSTNESTTAGNNNSTSTIWPMHFESFDEYKNHLNRKYHRSFEETRGRTAFADNMERIRIHNDEYKSGKHSYQIRPNQFADMSTDEYLKAFVRLGKSNRRKVNVKMQEEFSKIILGDRVQSHLPEAFDWRAEGFETPVNNQKSCGSCYAFSIAHTVQAQVFKRIGRVIPLSEQQIVDCSVRTGNHGCAGGSLRNTLKYVQKSGGLMREQDYPYAAAQHKCLANVDLAIVNITTWGILPARDENAMKLAIATIGPIAISINASPKTFQLYSHGIYDDLACSSLMVNHAMLAVGYTPDYWILKNWWGRNWGDNGYMKIRRNRNMCGLANYAAFAVV